MLVLSRKIINLANFGFSDIPGVNATNPNPPCVDVKHHLSRLVFIHSEKSLQDVDDELHRGKVIIQQEDLKKRRTLELRFCLLYSQVIVWLVGVLFRHF